MGQAGAGSREGQVKRKAHPKAASILESHLALPAPTLPDRPSRAVPTLTVFSFDGRCQGLAFSQKNTGMPSARAISQCSAISLP